MYRGLGARGCVGVKDFAGLGVVQGFRGLIGVQGFRV